MIDDATQPTQNMASYKWMKAMETLAGEVTGGTFPNPPVAALLVDESDQLLISAAHQRAGEWHAERRVWELFRASPHKDRDLSQATLYVSLEPCSHYGRQPPCTETLLQWRQTHGLSRIVFAFRDPHSQGGVELLRAAGFEVLQEEPHPPLLRTLRPFFSRIERHRPWVILKSVLRPVGAGAWTMIPPQGQKTFSDKAALHQAHILRAQSDAYITGLGTVLADFPEFTIRHEVQDPRKVDSYVQMAPALPRSLYVFSRTPNQESRLEFLLESLPADQRLALRSWIESRAQHGLQVEFVSTVQETLARAQEKGELQLLVEAGPQVSRIWLEQQHESAPSVDEQWLWKATESTSFQVLNIHKGESPCLLGL